MGGGDTCKAFIYIRGGGGGRSSPHRVGEGTTLEYVLRAGTCLIIDNRERVVMYVGEYVSV